MQDGPRLQVTAKVTLKKFDGDVLADGTPPVPVEIVETEETFDLLASDVITTEEGEP